MLFVQHKNNQEFHKIVCLSVFAYNETSTNELILIKFIPENKSKQFHIRLIQFNPLF